MRKNAREPRVDWTAEEEQFLLENRSKMTSGQIALRLKKTRNAVLGKIDRLRKQEERLKAEESVAVVESSLTGVTIGDLTDFSCLWPMGDPSSEGFHYCGRTRSDKRYCEEHAAISRAEPLRKKAVTKPVLRRSRYA